MTLLFLFFSRYSKPRVGLRRTLQMCRQRVASRHAPPPPPLASASEGCGTLQYVHLSVVLRDMLIYYLFIHALLSCDTCSRFHSAPRFTTFAFPLRCDTTLVAFPLRCDATLIAFPLRCDATLVALTRLVTCRQRCRVGSVQ